jgi:putative sporulation protein YyaC
MNSDIQRSSVNVFSYNFNATASFINRLKELTQGRKLVFACIGTDRSTGDSLGPLVGTSLKKLGYSVVGTLETPLHAQNLEDQLEYIQKELRPDLILAIDACLGRIDSIGTILLEEVPARPGAGVHKELPTVGDISIMGIVNLGGFCELQVIQSTRLHTVMTMANEISHLIWRAIPITREKSLGVS